MIFELLFFERRYLSYPFMYSMSMLFVWRERCLRFLIYVLVFILWHKTGNFLTFFGNNIFYIA